MARRWTREEKDYLAEKWGTVSIPTICEKLNRSQNSIMNMVFEMGLGSFLCSGDYVTFNQLLQAIGCYGKGSYREKSWIEERGFPIRYIRRNKMKIAVVYIDDFWEWAEKNQSFLDFSKFEENAIGREPEWAKRKRKDDIKKIKGLKKIPWTPYEDEKLKVMLRQNRYSCSELSKILHRTEGAIQRRITDLGLKERPVPASKQGDWTDDQVSLLGGLIKDGYSYEAIHEKIDDKSTKAIRAYVYRFYMTENLDTVRQYIGDGKFGDNIPPKKLRQRNQMTPEERSEAMDGVSYLAYLLNQRARQISPVAEKYKDYWQKDMCMNWSDIHGCTAGEKNCDSCNSFVRVQPQYCKRCGGTFFERHQTDFCHSCRLARLKQAQRKYAVLNKKGYYSR